MREEGKQDQRRLAARNSSSPVPACRTRSPSSELTIELMDWQRWQVPGNAMQKEQAEYFAQIREARIEDQRRLAGASDGQPDILMLIRPRISVLCSYLLLPKRDAHLKRKMKKMKKKLPKK